MYSIYKLISTTLTLRFVILYETGSAFWRFFFYFWGVEKFFVYSFLLGCQSPHINNLFLTLYLPDLLEYFLIFLAI